MFACDSLFRKCTTSFPGSFRTARGEGKTLGTRLENVFFSCSIGFHCFNHPTNDKTCSYRLVSPGRFSATSLFRGDEPEFLARGGGGAA